VVGTLQEIGKIMPNPKMCLSCEKEPIKYATYLCELCHQIACCDDKELLAKLIEEQRAKYA
jgi:hypothetical protein